MATQNDKTGIRVDLHTHSSHTGEHIHSSWKSLISASMACGLGMMSVTDPADETFDLIREKPREYMPGVPILDSNSEAVLFEMSGKRLYLVRGIEYRIPEGHFLIIGGDRKIESRRTLTDTLAAAIDNGAICGPAHPLNAGFAGCSRKVVEDNLGYFSFVESFNALSTRRYNRESTVMAIEMGLPQICSSDDHQGKPGSAHTILEGELTWDLRKDVEYLKNSVIISNVVDLKRTPTSCYSKLKTFVFPRFKNITPRSVYWTARLGLRYLRSS